MENLILNIVGVIGILIIAIMMALVIGVALSLVSDFEVNVVSVGVIAVVILLVIGGSCTVAEVISKHMNAATTTLLNEL